MSKNEKVTNAYNEDSIQVLEGLEAVRKRPGMYIGTVSVRGLHHLIYEIVDNSVDEALAGYCTEINITINQDKSVVVEDHQKLCSHRHQIYHQHVKQYKQPQL